MINVKHKYVPTHCADANNYASSHAQDTDQPELWNPWQDDGEYTTQNHIAWQLDPDTFQAHQLA